MCTLTNEHQYNYGDQFILRIVTSYAQRLYLMLPRPSHIFKQQKREKLKTKLTIIPYFPSRRPWVGQ